MMGSAWGSPKLRLLRRNLLMVTYGVERARARANEINGQKSHWVPQPGGVGSPRPQPWSGAKRTSQPEGGCRVRSRHRWDGSLRCRTVTVVGTQDSRNVNASIRALNSSPTLDGRGPIYIWAPRGRSTSIPCYGPQPRAPLATCWCMRLT